jgi:hypothetical protein
MAHDFLCRLRGLSNGISDLVSSNKWTNTGGATVIEGAGAFGGYAINIDNDKIMSLANEITLKGTNKWTISLWSYKLAVGTWDMIMSNSDGYCTIQNGDYSTPNKIGARISSMYYSINTGIPQTLNKWTHIALTNDGSTTRLFVGGLLKGTRSADDFRFSKLSYDNQAGYACRPGYIDDLCIINNEVLWTSDFTPPTSYLFGTTFFLAKTADEHYHSYKTGSWVDLGIPADHDSLIVLFQNSGSDFIPSQSQLELIGTGANRPKRCCWQKTVGATIPSIKLTAVPFDQLVLPKSLISVGTFEGIDNVTAVGKVEKKNTVVTSSNSGDLDETTIKFIVSTDLLTYKTYDFTTNVWETIDVGSKTVIKANGIDLTLLSTIPAAKWNELISSATGIAFGFLLCQSYSADSCLIDALTMQVDMKGSWDKAIHGTDYKYGYPKNNLLKVALLTSGDYKINYSEGIKEI